MPDESVLLTSAEVADVLRVSRQTVHRWTQDGVLVAVPTPGRNLRYRRVDIEKLLTPTAADVA